MDLFDKIQETDRKSMLKCINAYARQYTRGDYIRYPREADSLIGKKAACRWRPKISGETVLSSASSNAELSLAKPLPARGKRIMCFPIRRCPTAAFSLWTTAGSFTPVVWPAAFITE